MSQLTNDQPKKLTIFEEHHEGYWTGDCECYCFNPISPLHDRRRDEVGMYAWSDACTYISLQGLDPTKKYRVKLTVEAEEIEP